MQCLNAIVCVNNVKNLLLVKGLSPPPNTSSIHTSLIVFWMGHILLDEDINLADDTATHTMANGFGCPKWKALMLYRQGYLNIIVQSCQNLRCFKEIYRSSLCFAILRLFAIHLVAWLKEYTYPTYLGNLISSLLGTFNQILNLHRAH